MKIISELPVAIYGVVLFFSAVAYYILSLFLISHHGKDSTLAEALGSDFKGQISLVIYAVAMGLAFYESRVSLALYSLVAIMWLIPDRRIEKIISQK